MSLWSLQGAFIQKADVGGTPQKVVFLPGCPGSPAGQGTGRSPHVWITMKWTCPSLCGAGEAVRRQCRGWVPKMGSIWSLPDGQPQPYGSGHSWQPLEGSRMWKLDFGRACFFKEAGDCHVHSRFSVDPELNLLFLLPEPPCHFGWYNMRGGGMCVGGGHPWRRCWTSANRQNRLIGSWGAEALQNEMWPCFTQSVRGSFHQLNSWSLFITG